MLASVHDLLAEVRVRVAHRPALGIEADGAAERQNLPRGLGPMTALDRVLGDHALAFRPLLEDGTWLRLGEGG
ncbi:hypothetical protein [Sorangium sp. So ce1078]|uniref:hypothetical protein n=1 Tax=Sorangium sp. So ce1078 TaxID=3133329 RepID=UPI003F5FB140